MEEMKLSKLKRVVVEEVPIIIDKAGGMIYSIKNMQGPNTWTNVRNADYGKNPETGVPFRQTTFPEATRIAYFGIDKKVNEVIEAVNGSGKVLTGNTLVVYTPKNVYAVDFPEQEIIQQLRNGDRKSIERIAQTLDSQLGKREENNVIFSDNNQIRQTKREGLENGILSSKSALAKNRLVIALSGSLENADLTSQTAGNYAQNPAVYPSSEDFAVRVPVLLAVGFGRLCVYGSRLADYDYRCSFGGQKIAEGNALKNGGNK